MDDYKIMFEQAVRTLAAIDEALGIGDDGCSDPEQTLYAIADLKASSISEEANDILRAKISDLERKIEFQKKAWTADHEQLMAAESDRDKWKAQAESLARAVLTDQTSYDNRERCPMCEGKPVPRNPLTRKQIESMIPPADAKCEAGLLPMYHRDRLFNIARDVEMAHGIKKVAHRKCK